MFTGTFNLKKLLKQPLNIHFLHLQYIFDKIVKKIFAEIKIPITFV